MDDRMQVLRVFFEDGVLRQLPARQRKKEIVLEEIVRMLPEAASFDEREINALVTPIFGDYCVIRRLLIDIGLMERKDGQYRFTAKGRALRAA